MLWILVILCSEDGSAPVNLLKQIWKDKRLGSLKPISLGISPRRWFDAKTSVTMEEKLKSDEGTIPDAARVGG